jgi:hypothetical protein
MLTCFLVAAFEGSALAAEGKALVTLKDGELVYAAAGENGDTIPDFSNCGYMGGGVPLPNIKVMMAIYPKRRGDDTGRIQDALEKVARMRQSKNGFRGTLLLKAGTYRVAGTLMMQASGVILRGEVTEEASTVIIATGTKKRTLIQVQGQRGPGREVNGTRRDIVDKRVPVGAKTFRLNSTRGLRQGDAIAVFRPGTKEWIKKLGTDKLNRGPEDKVNNWRPTGYNFAYERIIVEMRGNAITIDAPIVFAIEERFGGGYVYKTSTDRRIHHVGVEQLRLVSEFEEGKETSDESHAWDAIRIGNTIDSWVRDVTAVHFGYSCVNIIASAKRITVQDSACIDPVSRISGGRRYSFALDGQLCLVQRCYTRGGRHDYVMHARARGPNVFLDCVADKPHSDSGPHHRWATGTLYDNIKCGHLNVQWRGRSGTGHGWAGANMVFWNCRAKRIDCQKPPTANNYCIGCTGRIRGKGYIESKGKPVLPRSLYLKQLEERVGVKAVLNVTTQEQRDGILDRFLKKTFSGQTPPAITN